MAKAQQPSIIRETAQEAFWSIGGFFALIVFIGVWGYTWYAYGMIVGAVLGWVPAMILAGLFLFFWPFMVWMAVLMGVLWMIAMV
mgnify:CR=1 FL=1